MKEINVKILYNLDTHFGCFKRLVSSVDLSRSITDTCVDILSPS